MNRNVRQTVLPLLAAMIWGTAFAFQSMSTDHIGPFTFTAGRAVIATASLAVVLLFVRLYRNHKQIAPPCRNHKKLLLGGVCCGSILAFSATMQQAGLAETSAGKTAFITALYIVIVPVIGLFSGKKLSRTVALGVLTAVIGLYFLCITEEFVIVTSDILVLICAFGFAGHIMSVDYFVQFCDGIELSCIQFAVEAFWCMIGAVLFEIPSISALLTCILPLLYVGVFSSAVAFTLQIIAQKDANPTVVSIILSLESLFGAVSGAILLHESMSGRELFGCAMMLIATVMAQIPDKTSTTKL